MSTLSSAWPEAPEVAVDPFEESLRVSELLSLKLLDSQPEYRFDRITRLAAEFFHVATAYVAFIDDRRQWLKSSVGMCHVESPRDMTFCQYTIHRDRPLVIPDTHLHPMSRKHPLVTGEPHVRFYAGVPLSGPTGKKIGTFCLVDLAPKEFDEQATTSLLAFASLVEREINLGEIIQTQNDLLITRERLVETQHLLEREFSDAAKYVRLMLPPPLDGEEIVDWHFIPSTRLGGDGLGYRRLNDDQFAIYILDVTGHGLGSAMLAVTVLELLRNPAVQLDFTRPSVVMARLNRTFQMKDHAGKFFSVWYGVYSRSRRTLTYANAGHPPALILTRDGDGVKVEKTAPGGSVLGIMPDLEIPETTIPFPASSEIYLFTDGLYELLDAAGGRGSYAEFLEWIETQVEAGSPAWKAILGWHEEAQVNKLVDDDVSLLRFATKE